MDKHTRKRLLMSRNALDASLRVFADSVMGANKEGYSFAEIADALSVPVDSLMAVMRGKEDEHECPGNDVGLGAFPG